MTKYAKGVKAERLVRTDQPASIQFMLQDTNGYTFRAASAAANAFLQAFPENEVWDDNERSEVANAIFDAFDAVVEMEVWLMQQPYVLASKPVGKMQ